VSVPWDETRRCDSGTDRAETATERT
jgi:hypothetical protein